MRLSCRRLPKVSHPHQIINGRREGEEPDDSRYAPEFDLAEQPHRLHAAEGLVDPFAFLLTDCVARVPRGPAINRTGPVRRVLGHMGRDLPCPKILHELLGVVVLIAPPQGDASGQRVGIHQGQGGVPLRGPRGGCHYRLNDQPVAVLHEDMPHETQFSLPPLRLLVQACGWIGGRDMRGIRRPLPTKVDTRVPRIIGGR